jgi:hypothetical protein
MKSGDLFERVFPTPAGDVALLAEVEIDGATLVLKDVAVYPVEPVRLSVGPATIARSRDALATEIAALGFDSLRLIGIRFSGAAPGKEVDVTIDLTRFR